MKIGIAGAMLAEIDLLVKDMTEVVSETVGNRVYHTGRLYGHDVVMVYTKCGKVAASAAITTLIERYKADIIIYTGVAGAVDSNLEVGDVVVADRLIQHDFDLGVLSVSEDLDESLTARLMFRIDDRLVRLFSGSAEKYLNADMPGEIDSELLAEFGISKPKVITGTIASGDKFISDKAVVKSLSSRIGGLKCVEMEGAAAAQLAYDYKIPLLICRIISDKADEHANFNFYRFIEKTATQFIRGIIRSLLADLDTVSSFPEKSVITE